MKENPGKKMKIVALILMMRRGVINHKHSYRSALKINWFENLQRRIWGKVMFDKVADSKMAAC